MDQSDFNSRSCEGATNQRHILDRGCRISTHAPVKERLTVYALLVLEINFNSRSCEGATGKPINECHRIVTISTHAPVKERRFRWVRCPICHISTHAPVKERRVQADNRCTGRKISTHAPVKERPTSHNSTVSGLNFNSRSCEGATQSRSQRHRSR